MSYQRTPETTAWMRVPWTCPRCNHTFPTAGKGTHLKWCGQKREETFWSHVAKLSPSECWLWTGSRFKFTGRQRGYGRFSGSGPYTYAHRAAWIFTHGDIPDGKLIMHTCDVPLCCNPSHLRLGTDAENHADSVAKGRHTRGERTRMNKLTEEQVREIIPLKGTISGPKLAKRYGVGPGAINAIWRGDYWKHVPRNSEASPLPRSQEKP